MEFKKINTIENKGSVEDNARKFTVGKIDEEFLTSHNASSFMLTIDWIEATKDVDKKLARKVFENGEVQILLISKVATNGNRVADRRIITEEEYQNLLPSSTKHMGKKRTEFIYEQNKINFKMKYDEFVNSNLKLLEVDAPSDEERNKFNPKEFPYKINEVTDDPNYTGDKITTVL